MGEFDLLEKIRERLPPAGPRVVLGSGDDAAVTVPAGAAATSVDAVVDGVHFRRDSAAPAQIGAKALAAALSDLAAMGAAPGEAYIVLCLPPEVGEDECLELLDGIAAVAAETGTALAGGDLTRSPVLTISVTVVGYAEGPELLVARGGGRPGDELVVTGELGGAAAGLLLLQRDRDGSPPPAANPVGDDERAALVRRQLEPRPRLAAGAALARCGATAMIDISDGLGGDATRLAEACGTGVSIEAAAVPLAAGVEEVARGDGRDPLELAVGGGEDYELLAALPPRRLEEAMAAVGESGTTLTPVGRLGGTGGVEIRLPAGGLLEPRGFDQLG